MAQQTFANGDQTQQQQQGNKPQPEAAREAPPPPVEKDPKPKDGSLTQLEGRATGVQFKQPHSHNLTSGTSRPRSAMGPRSRA